MIEHLSYSSINTFLECPMQWKFRYIDKIESPPSPELIFGSAFHRTVEDIILGDSSDVLKVWNTNAREQIMSDNVPVDTPWIQDILDAGDDMFQSDSVRDLVSNLKPLYIDGKPAVEKKIELYISDVPVPIIGYIDIIAQDGIPGDFKTSKRKWAKSRASEELQPLFYLAAINRNKSIAQPFFRHYIFVKEEPYDVQVIESEFSDGQMEFLKDVIRNVWTCMNSGCFHENPKTWLCDEKWCPYYAMCRGKYGG